MTRLPKLRIADEEGMALVLAVLLMAIVTISAFAAIAYTSANQRDAFSKKAGTTAYSLAQGALSNAMSQLTAHYYDDTGQPNDNTTPLASQSGWAPSGSQISTNSTSACTTVSTCMTWSATFDTTGPFTGVQQAAWHITATGKVPNPSATGLLTRTIKVDVPVNAPPSQVGAPSIMKAVYAGKPATNGCDMTVPQGATLTSPVYVVGNLCIQQTGGIESPGTLAVGGWLTTSQQGHVGKTSAPISSLAVAGACGAQALTPACSLVYTAAGNYWQKAGSSIYATAQASNSPTFPTIPAINWTARQQESASFSCTGGKSLTSATFDLAGSAYSCTTPAGSLVWDGTTLTITGNIYVSGNLTTSNNADFVYSGIGNIFVGGTATFGNNTAICVGSVTNHACPSGPNWDTTHNFIDIVAKGTVSGKNFNLEGGLYSDILIDFGSGQTGIDGPLVTPQSINLGQQASSGFPNIVTVESGGPDAPAPFWQLGAPTNGQY